MSVERQVGISNKMYRKEEYISWEEKTYLKIWIQKILLFSLTSMQKRWNYLDKAQNKTLKKYIIASGNPDILLIGSWQIKQSEMGKDLGRDGWD